MNMLGSIVGYPAEVVMKYVTRYGAYVIRYKNKVQELDQENRRLGEKKERIQDMVNTATNNGKVIITEVSSWLEEVVQMEREIANILHPQENRESFKCFPGCMCPNIMWRHMMGKEADTRKSDVSGLISRGERLESLPVAHDACFQSELLFDSSQYYTPFPSRASVFSEIMNALTDSGVDMIGVHGPGGAGKTTMVKEVANDAKKQGIFDKIVVAVVSKDPDTLKLQEAIEPQLDITSERKDKVGRADELRNALLNGKRKILLIFDDLWQKLDLNAIGIPISSLGDTGCKIMLTSRKKGVLEAMLQEMEVRPLFFIDYLEEQEAWELFTKVTGNCGVDERIGDCRVDGRIAREVCKKCANMPIAIVAVAAALRPREEVVWNNALLELEESPVKHIEGIEGVEQNGYTPLRWSYDFLQPEGAKSCFLLCCLFPEDAEISIDDLVRYSLALGFLGKMANTLQHARTIVQTMVDELKRSCLLLDGAQENFVKMHDVIRDVAIVITREKQAGDSSGQDWPSGQQFLVDHNFQEWPENDAWEHHTAISLRIKGKFSFPCGLLHCPPMHTLVLKSEKNSSLKIPNDFIQGGKAPRVLDFENISLDFQSLDFERNDLRMLRLKDCELLGELSTIRNLKKNLKIFIFEDTEIKKLPEEIGELTHLQVLDLMCWQLEVIPKGVISKLRNLEELYVGGWFMKWDTDTTVDGGEMSNARISELKSLDKLTSLHVRISAKSFKIMAEECLDLFTKLSKFYIFINCFWLEGPSGPNVLEIDGRGRTGEGLCPLIEKVDPLMEKVHDLSLTYIPDLRYLEYFTSSGGGSYHNLTYLFISNCHSMKYIFSPSCARELQQLQRLEVRDCREMEQIIGVADNYHGEEVVTDEAIIFRQLRKLTLRGLPRFRSFYPKIGENSSNWTTTAESIFNEKVSFPSLEKLTITNLLVKDIWNKQMIQSPNRSNNVSFSRLKMVYISECENLVFPSHLLMLTFIPNLNYLLDNQRLQITSRGAGSYMLRLTCIPDLRYLPGNQLLQITSSGGGSFSKLTALYIRGCGSMKYIFSPSCARELQQLQSLDVSDCGEMEQIIGVADNYQGEEVVTDETIIFTQLRFLTLQRLPRFRSFYPKIGENSSNWTTTAESIFNEKVSFPSLENLTVEELPVKYIWNKQMIQFPNRSNNVSFFQLKEVDICRCENLINVFPSNMLSQLQNLEILLVGDCHPLTLIVEGLNLNSESRTMKSSYSGVFPKLRSLEFFDEDSCYDDSSDK